MAGLLLPPPPRRSSVMGESPWRLAGADGEEQSLMGEVCWEEREGEGLCGGGAAGFTNLSGLGLGLGLCNT